MIIGVKMNCKRCGSVLPSEGFVCKVCGAMMDNEQIKSQKANLKSKIGQIPILMSEQNGKHKIEYNSESPNKGMMAAIMLIIIIFLVIVSLLIFFLKK